MHCSVVNCVRVVPEAKLKSNGSVIGAGAGTVTHWPSEQHVTALAWTVQLPA